MLFKNDELQKLNAKEIEKVEKHFHNKFPVKVTYPPERIVKSRLKHNRLPDKPASISFSLKATVKTSSGTEIWRYAENVITGEHGVKKYEPTKFMFNGMRYLERNDIELIYFLLYKSDRRAYTEDELKVDKSLKQVAKAKFVFEDLVTAAEKKMEQKQLQHKIDALIFGELALPEERLREVAHAMFIDNVDGFTLSQVRLTLEAEVKRTKEGPDKFFDMVNADEELATRANVKKLINAKILEFNVQGRSWSWKIPGGKDVRVFTVPANVENATEALYTHYKGNQEFRDDVKAALISKNPLAGKKKEEVVED